MTGVGRDAYFSLCDLVIKNGKHNNVNVKMKADTSAKDLDQDCPSLSLFGRRFRESV